MRTLIALIFAVTLLTGCPASIPVKNSFPDLPTDLMTKPVELKTLQTVDQDSKIGLKDETPSSIAFSQLIKSVTDNYKTCNEYREQIFGLQNWLTNQKKLNP